MTPLENIYMAIGQMAYAIAKSDGEVQFQEREQLEEILSEEFEKKVDSANHASIIFRVMEKENLSADQAYDAAMKELKMNSHYLSSAMKKHIIHIIERVAAAYPPITEEEDEFIRKFMVDVMAIKVDPVLSKDL